MGSNPPPPPSVMPPFPPYLPAPAPFYTWGATAPPGPPSAPPAPGYGPSLRPPSASSAPVTPKQLSAPPPPKPSAVICPVRPGKDSDYTQHALNTVVAAAGAVHNQARASNPAICERPHIRTSVAGVKRKGLASELLAAKADSYHTSWVSAWDTLMPAELLSKCKPLHCELCGCQATSPIQTKMHYEGKTHDKNVRNFFMNWSGNTKNVVPQKIAPSDKKPKPSQGTSCHSHLHCDVCDLYFTSQMQLDQHLVGKNHMRKADLCNKPSGTDGSSIKASSYNRETHRWEKKNDYRNEDDIREEIETPSVSTNPPANLDPNFNKLYCDLCKVGAPNQPQMDMHLNGKSHKSKMNRSMGGLANNDLEAISKRVKLKQDIMAASKPKVQNKLQNRTDYSSFRTPSGQYYCSACNLSVNSEIQFGQHQTSKKHRQKIISQRSRNF